MKTVEVAFRARMYANDVQKSRYSDYEVYAAINDAVRIIAREDIHSAHHGISFRRRKEIKGVTPRGGAALPEGYIDSIHAFDADGVELLRVYSDIPKNREYAVRGGAIFSPSAEIELYYYGLPPRVARDEDELDLPEFMMTPVAKTAAALLTGADSSALSAAQYFIGNPSSSSTGGDKA